MSRPANTRLIGLFVLGAVALGVALVLILGGGRYLGSSKRYVAYFEGSVNGLNVGAPVKLKGVNIGRVTDVLVQYDLENNRVRTPVIVQVDLRKVTDIGNRRPAWRRPSLQELIDRGLRARLTMQSLLTSQLYVDIDFRPERPLHLTGIGDLGLPELPTIPSGREELENTLQEAMVEFRELPLKDLFAAVLRVVRRVDQLLAKPETEAAVRHLDLTLEDVDRLIRHLDGKIDALAGTIDGTTKDSRLLIRNLNERVLPLLATAEKVLTAATGTLTQARGALTALEGLASPDSELSAALRDFSDAARSIRNLADTLERNPETLIYGRKDRVERR